MKRTVLTNVHVSYPFISALCFELTSTVVHISGITVATTHVYSVTDLDIKGMQGDIPWLTAGITKTTVTAFAKKEFLTRFFFLVVCNPLSDDRKRWKSLFLMGFSAWTHIWWISFRFFLERFLG